MYHGPLFRLHHGHENIEQEDKGHDDDAELQNGRLFQERHAPGPAQNITDNGRDSDERKQDQLKICQFGAVEFGLRLLRNYIIRSAHETEEQPYHEKIDVDSARRVKGQDIDERVVVPHVLGPGDEAEQYLESEEDCGNYKKV